jgi:hypothetical protein
MICGGDFNKRDTFLLATATATGLEQLPKRFGKTPLDRIFLLA